MRTRDLSLVIWAAAAAIAVAVAESESEGEADGDGRNLHEVLHNPYRSRGASLVYKTFHHSGNPEAAFSYFYDDRIPIPANLRRQRQFVSEPVVLPTTRFAPQTRQEEVKALPSRPQARPGFFFSPVSPAQQQSFVFPPPPPPPPQAHTSSLFQQQQQQSFQHHQLQLFEQQRQQQILEQQRQQRQLAEEQQQQVHAQPQPPQLLVQEQPPPPASASSASVVPTPEQSPQQQQQQPSLSPFRLQDAVTTTTSTLLFPTTSFARGTHLKPVPAVPPRLTLTLTTDPEEQRSAPPTTESSFAQIRFGAQPSGPTARPVVPAAGAAAAEPFSRPVVNVRSRQTTLSAARPVTAPPTVATAAETAAAASEGKETKTVKRVRKPVRKVRKLKPVVHIVPVSTAAPLPSSSEHVPTAPTVAPTAASRSQATGFRALRPRPFKGITGLRGRLHHGNSDNKLR